MKNQFSCLRRSLCLALPVLALALSSPVASAQDVFGPPSTVDYQGVLKGPDGTPLGAVSPTNYEVKFRLYDAQTGGNVIWAEKQIVTVSGGLFSVRLGEGEGIPAAAGGGLEGSVGHASPGLPGAFGGKERFLGVTVTIPGQTPAEITPRLAFLASPFSYVAARAQSADRLVQSASGQPSSLNVGSVSYVPLVVTAGSTLSGNNTSILADATAAAFTTTLPSGVTGAAGEKKEFTVTKTDASANVITVAPPGGGNINGNAASLTLPLRGDSVTLRNTDGNNWWITSRINNAVQELSGDSLTYTPLVATATTTLTGENSGVLANATAAAMNVTLPSGLAGSTGEKREFTVTKTDTSANAVTVRLTGAGTINGTTNDATTAWVTLPKQGDSVTLRHTSGNNWWSTAGNVVSGLTFRDPDGSSDTGIFSTGENQMSVRTGGSERAVVSNAGTFFKTRVHIGSPTDAANFNNAALHISSTAVHPNQLGFLPIGYGYVESRGVFSVTGVVAPNSIPLGLYVARHIASESYVAFSDARIKNIQGVSDGAKDLNSLMGIEVTDYTFRDQLAKGNRPQKKVIAQQVEKVYPQAVSLMRDVVPDIMKRATIEGGWISLATDLKKGDKVRLFTPNKPEPVMAEVLETRDGGFRTDLATTEKEVFVYGRLVEDFRAVDYEAVAMLNVSATQQVKKDSDSAEAALRRENASLRDQLKETQERLDALEKADKTRESRLAALEAALLGKEGKSTAVIFAK